MFNIGVLKSVFPGMVTMKANTAAGLMLCGVALALLSRQKVGAPVRAWVAIMAAAVIVLGSLTMGEYLFGSELGIDQWLFRGISNIGATSQRVRMSPTSAFCLLLAGCALLASSRPIALRLRFSILAALGASLLAVGALALAGHVTGVLLNAPIWDYAGMSFHTAVAFALLGCGFLAMVKYEKRLGWVLDGVTTGGFVVGIVSLITAAAISFHFTLRLQRTATWVSRTEEALKGIEKLSAGVSELGSSQRNFINTGDERFLTEEKESKDALRRDVIELRAMTTYDARQQKLLDQIQPLIAERITWGEQTVAARRQKGLAAAEQIIASGVGVSLSASIRHTIQEMEDAEYSVLQRQQQEEETVSQTTFLLLPLGMFLSITMLCLGLFFLNTAMGERAMAMEKAAWLASFPEVNPNPIIELDLATGKVHYVNPFAIRLIPDLPSMGLSHPWLAGLREAVAALVQNPGEPLRREVAAGDLFFAQTISYIPETKRIRVYGADITERKQAEIKLEAHLARLNLLHHITRAISERQDLASILQVVVLSLEDNLPVDFSCVCVYEQSSGILKVARFGLKSEPVSLELGLTEHSVIPIDENGLSRCLRGELVYEPDISQIQFPFPQRLARAGLRSLVIAPLLVESKVFGILVAARRLPAGFVSGECEFLKQLSEHVALASQQSQLHEALQQAYDDLHQTQQAVMQQERLRALGQMASGIAHDINNAISPVSLYTESLLEHEPNLSERGRAYLETIGRAVDDVAATVARMKEFYRQRESGSSFTAVDLNEMLRHVVDLTRARWSDMALQRGIVIKMEAQPAPELPAVMGAESEIREALINLVLNSVDAMPEGGALTLRTNVVEAASTGSPASRHVQLEVTDTGIGMDEETRRRCFEPFFTTKGDRGTGLGMAMVYGIINRHNADIEIESAVGRGTTVRLIFPVAPTPVVDSNRSARPTAVPSRLRILLVDDDPLLIKSLRDTLEGDGHSIAAANGGQAGIEAFLQALKANQPFAVVITDLGMPHVDGRKVAAEVKAASPATPVILLTGWGQRLLAEGDVPSNVDRVLAKPPKLRDLREALALLTQS
jgi:signal transduction histidine kinase/CHASE3 domain sensor protein/ActR/RegA family two-component response regulator